MNYHYNLSASCKERGIIDVGEFEVEQVADLKQYRDECIEKFGNATVTEILDTDVTRITEYVKGERPYTVKLCDVPGMHGMFAGYN